MPKKRQTKTAKPDLTPVGTVVGLADRWAMNVSSGLAPTRLASIIRNADAGSWTDLLDLYDEIEDKDVHLSAELFKRRMAVAGLPWEVVPAVATAGKGSASDGRAEEIAAFCTEVLRQIPNFLLALLELTEAVSHGFAAAEIMWQYYDYAAPNGSGAPSSPGIIPGAPNGSGAGVSRLWVDELRLWPQRRFVLDPVDPAGLRIYRAAGQDEQLPDNKFVVHRYTRKGSLLKAGLLRKLLWLFLFKNYSIKDWVSFLEIFAVPLRVGTYGPGASPGDIEILTRAVIDVAVDQGAVISEACKIQFIEAQRYGTSDAFERFARFINAEMSKLIVGQTLSAQTSESGGGAMALGQVHAEVRQDIVELDAPLLQETITRDLLIPLVDFNFGEQDRYPQFKLHYEQPADTQALALMLKTAGEAGVKIGQAWAQKQLGIPAPEEDDEVLRPLAPPATVGPTDNPLPASARDAGLNLKSTVNHEPSTVKGREARIAAASAQLAPIYEAYRKICASAAVAGKLPELDFEQFKKFLASEMLAADLTGRAEELVRAGLARLAAGGNARDRGVS